MDNENNKFTKCSFLEALDNKFHSIPKYQREFAVGRVDGDSDRKIKNIRDGYINDFYNALNKGEPLKLNLIYGGITNSGETFQPVDGQQRLTILFLFHWFVFALENNDSIWGKNDDGSVRSKMSKFTCDTRRTTREFLNDLLDPEKNVSKLLADNDLYAEPKPPEKKTENKLFADGNIGKLLVNQPWFTGNMQSDPNVRSMLVVLDRMNEVMWEKCKSELEEDKYSDENERKNWFDDKMKDFSEKLRSANCPICFYEGKVEFGAEDSVLDLYIKMNGRGVPLTPFEIVKSRLEKRVNDLDKVDLLYEYLKDKIDSSSDEKVIGEERKTLINKLNTDYAELFFELVDGCKLSKDNKYDDVMMNLFNVTFQTNYFEAIDDAGVPKQASKKSETIAYTNDMGEFQKSVGKQFSDFIENAGKEYAVSYKELDTKHVVSRFKPVLVKAIDEVFLIMDTLLILQKDKFDLINKKGELGYDEKADILNRLKQENRSAKDVTAITGIHGFLRAYNKEIECKDSSIKELFDYWSRFVYKVTEQPDIKNYHEIIPLIQMFRDLIEKRCQNVEDLIKEVASIDISNYKLTKEIKKYVEREIKKANLSSDKDWRVMIEEAEDRFANEGGMGKGNIEALLVISDTDKDKFEQCKKIFDMIQDNKDDIHIQLETALLIFQSEGDHMRPMSDNNRGTKRVEKDKLLNYWTLSDDDDTERYNYTIEFTKDLINRMKGSAYGLSDLKAALDDYKNVPVNQSGHLEYKKLLVSYPIIYKAMNNTDMELSTTSVRKSTRFQFKGGFEPDYFEGKYTAIYDNEKSRNEAAELASFILCLLLMDEYNLKDRIRYITKTFKEDKYIEGYFPNRYFQVLDNNDKELFKVGYMNGEFYKQEGKSAPECIGDMEKAKKHINDEITKLPKTNDSSN